MHDSQAWRDPTDIGARMFVARLVLGCSRRQVAAQLQVSPKTYAGYELGAKPVLARLEQIAQVLGVTAEYLLEGPIRGIQASELSYRRRVAVKSPEAMHIQGLASLATQLRRLIERYVQLPAPIVPYAPVSTIADAEDAARSLREHFQLGDAPLRSAISLAEALGVLVFWFDAHESFDGVSFWDGDQPYILLNRRVRDGYRVRFTVLHELGHLVCHRTGKTVEKHEEERRRIDREANAFASALLMPAASFARRFPPYHDLASIMEERRHWNASGAAMIMRARQLRLIDESTYRRLNVALSARGWRKGEPGAMPPEESRVHQFFFDEVGERGWTSVEVGDQISIPYSWLSEAMPLAGEYRTHVRLGRG